MRRYIIAASALLYIFAVTAAEAGNVRVRGSSTKTGVYRQPHIRTSPNNSKIDNWSTKGNVNPNTGKKGSADPFKPRIKYK